MRLAVYYNFHTKPGNKFNKNTFKSNRMRATNKTFNSVDDAINYINGQNWVDKTTYYFTIKDLDTKQVVKELVIDK